MRALSDIRFADDYVMDAYVPDTPAAGAVLVLHSGWFAGDKRDITSLAERLADAGMVVFVPNFRLPPHDPFSASRSDVLAALNWVNGSDFDFDRTKIAVWGFSAGGTLAIEAALATGLPAVAWSAMIDLKGFMVETTVLADRDYDHDFSALTRSDMEGGGRNDPLLRNLVLQLVANNASWLGTATPLSRVSGTSGPILMFNAVEELVPSDGAIALQRALCRSGVSSTVSILEGRNHGRENLDIGFEQALRFTSERFLAPVQLEVESDDLVWGQSQLIALGGVALKRAAHLHTSCLQRRKHFGP